MLKRFTKGQKAKIVHRPEGLSLAEYLAMEAEMVKTISEPTGFTWIVAPTVIYGKHQCVETEVNEAYCREHDGLCHLAERT